MFGIGFVNYGFDAFAPADFGKKIYLAANGFYSTTEPAAPNFVKEIGQIINARRLFVSLAPVTAGV